MRLSVIGALNPVGIAPSTRLQPVQSTSVANVNGTFVEPCAAMVARIQCLCPSP